MAKLTLLLGPLAKAFTETVDRLNDLPEDSDEIAKLFQTLELKGETANSEGCALAQFIKGGIGSKLLEQITVHVIVDTVVFDHGPVSLTYELPNHLTRFVRMFDRFKYPELLSHPVPAEAAYAA